MCGLAGFYPKKYKKVNISKLYSLFVLNEERGTHSCGITLGQKRIIGINTKSKARNLLETIQEEIADLDLTNLPVIAHTRHATVGSHTYNNAHPFQWFRGTEDNFFNFAHNGSLKDLPELKEKLKMDTKHEKNNMEIDSHVLGLAMYDTYVKSLTEEEVLTSYKGAAAFLCHDCNNVFKVWKGANNDIEERPMYYVETPEGWYFSSLEFALYLNFLKKPVELANNTLLTFSNYKLTSSIEYIRAIKDPVKVHTCGYNYSNTYKAGSYVKKSDNFITRLLKCNLSFILKQKDNTVNKYISLIVDGCNSGRYESEKSLINGEKNFLCDYENQKLELKMVSDDEQEVALFFKEGIPLKDDKSYGKLMSIYYKLQRENKSTGTIVPFQKIFEEMSKLKDEIVDFFPVRDKQNIIMVLYKKANSKDEELDYITPFDRKSVMLHTIFNEKVMISPNRETLTIKKV